MGQRDELGAEPHVDIDSFCCLPEPSSSVSLTAAPKANKKADNWLPACPDQSYTISLYEYHTPLEMRYLRQTGPLGTWRNDPRAR